MDSVPVGSNARRQTDSAPASNDPASRTGPGAARARPQPAAAVSSARGPGALQRYQRPRFEEPDEETVSLEQYLQILLRRKWLLVSVALTVVLLALLQVFTTTPIYRATATIQIDPEDQKVLPYEQVESVTVSGSRNLEQYLWTQAEKLRSRGLARRVVRALSLADNEAFTKPTRKGVLTDLKLNARSLVSRLFADSATGVVDERALIASFLGRLSVQPMRNTRLIQVSFDSPDPELAAQVANTLSEEFIEQHLEGKFDATTRATVFLEKQLEDLQIKVERSEQALLRYAQQQNIVNLGERETIARKRLADLSDELTRAETGYLSEQARYAATQAATLESFPEILKTDAMRGLEQRLSTLEGELSGLSNVYGPEWPRVKTLRSEIAGLEAQLDAQKRQALSSARQEAALAGNRQAQARGGGGRSRTPAGGPAQRGLDPVQHPETREREQQGALRRPAPAAEGGRGLRRPALEQHPGRRPGQRAALRGLAQEDPLAGLGPGPGTVPGHRPGLPRRRTRQHPEERRGRDRQARSARAGRRAPPGAGRCRRRWRMPGSGKRAAGDFRSWPSRMRGSRAGAGRSRPTGRCARRFCCRTRARRRRSSW